MDNSTKKWENIIATKLEKSYLIRELPWNSSWKYSLEILKAIIIENYSIGKTVHT